MTHLVRIPDEGYLGPDGIAVPKPAAVQFADAVDAHTGAALASLRRYAVELVEVPA